jgi:hypothetical protein
VGTDTEYCTLDEIGSRFLASVTLHTEGKIALTLTEYLGNQGGRTHCAPPCSGILSALGKNLPLRDPEARFQCHCVDPMHGV